MRWPAISRLIVSVALLGSTTQGASAAPSSSGPPGGVGPTILPAVVPTVFTGDVRQLARPSQIPPSDRPELEPPSLGPSVPSRDTTVQSTAPLANAPAPTLTFAGLDKTNWGNGWPPDTNGDVGPTVYVQAVNTSIGIFRKSDGVRLSAFTFSTLFSAAATGTPCDTSSNGDPVVLYDALANRWIVSDLSWSNFSSGPFYECLAVSITGDPVAGGWRFYAVQTDAGSNLSDYPKLGVWPDGIYMSANMFSTKGRGLFKNVRVWSFNRSDLESGAALRAVSFNLPGSLNGVSIFSLLPSNLRGTSPPNGRENLFASIWSAKVAHVWKFHSDWTTLSNSTLTGPSDVALSTWNVAPTSVPELNGNNLDTLREQLMMQNQYRNLAHTVANGSGVTSIRWYQLNVTGGNVVTGGPVQQGTWNPDSNNRFMPSIAVDGSGDMAIGYSVSSASMYPAIRYAGRLVTDSPNTLGQSETSLFAGSGAQTNTCGGNPCGRWGDYSAMSVDPVENCTFWYTNEYYATSGGNWLTRIGAFKYPSCTGSPSPTKPGSSVS